MRFTWQGREFELIDLAHMTFAETAHAERLVKKKADDWSTIDAMRVAYFASVRRVDHTLLSWSAMDDLAPADFEDVPEPDEDDAAEVGEPRDFPPAD